MIYKNGKEITALSFGTRAIGAVYYGAKKVWEAVSSCFGAGRWNNDKPWSNGDAYASLKNRE